VAELKVEQKNNQLVLLRRTPYGGTLARSSLDTVLAFAAFEQEISLLFLGEGVLQLCSNQDGKAIASKTVEKQIASLPLYGVETVYADADALQKYSISVDSLPVAVIGLDATQIQELIVAHKHVLSF